MQVLLFGLKRKGRVAMNRLEKAKKGSLDKWVNILFEFYAGILGEYWFDCGHDHWLNGKTINCTVCKNQKECKEIAFDAWNVDCAFCSEYASASIVSCEKCPLYPKFCGPSDSLYHRIDEYGDKNTIDQVEQMITAIENAREIK